MTPSDLPPPLATLAVWCALVYVSLGAVDALWLHLWRYRLHRMAPQEHRLHTLRTLLMPPVILLVAGPGAGVWLWFGVACAIVDLALVAWDAATEHTTRRFQDGLPAGEAALHTVLQALHAVVLVVGVAAKPAEAWRSGSVPVFSVTDLTGLLLLGLVAGSLAVAALHVWLWLRTRTAPQL
jgi:hypothetical protein